MTPRAVLSTALALAFVGPPALAQQQSGAAATPTPMPRPDGMAEAATALRDAAENALLVRDLLGKEVADPSGGSVGTIANLAVIPGGRIVAAILETPDGTRVPVPFAAVKVAAKASTVSLTKPLSELQAGDAYGALEDAAAQLGL
ncbi:PRC-barrel domain-containing protein [Salinarimonas sp.]|uniref:PRC-barrel domain-containing protein n=1 Tax=Salinarimonas sp. TaxID=2766526 RepID=UPI0032D91726